jgi:hypothetical protein
VLGGKSDRLYLCKAIIAINQMQEKIIIINKDYNNVIQSDVFLCE